jgi:hypothetical protein
MDDDQEWIHDVADILAKGQQAGNIYFRPWYEMGLMSNFVVRTCFPISAVDARATSLAGMPMLPATTVVMLGF